MLKIYGSPRTSANRCFLMLEEVGVMYTGMPIDMMEKKEHKSPEYLRLNPNGKVPCLVDGDFVIWESLAINYYLGEKYKPELLGKTPEQKGLMHQWSTWGMLELQAPMIDLFIQMVFVPEAKRDSNIIAKSKEKIPPLLKILDNALMGKDYLAGPSFTLADLNVASVVGIAPALQFPLAAYSGISAWMQKIMARPAFQKIAKLRGEH
jgi:glutathione S-transferase